jgi:hypothetical protein
MVLRGEQNLRPSLLTEKKLSSRSPMKISSLGLWLATAFATTQLHALQTNLVSIADTALRNASPDLSFGNVASLPAGVSTSGTTINHVLLRFPIEHLPANATVTEVTLLLTSVTTNQAGMNHNLFRVLKDWNETDTTWNTRIAPAIAWGAPGAQADVDYTTPASASALLDTAPSVNPFTTAAMLADVELWRANPGTNFGWILIAANEQAGSGKQIAGREDATRAPVLNVVYSLPAPSPAIFDAALINNQIRFSFSAEADQAYEVQFRTSLTAGDWNPLLFIPAAPVNTIQHVTNSVSGDAGFFRLRLTSDIASS